METADLSHHISRRFNEDLERVRSKVLGMGGFVEQQLHKAITALIETDWYPASYPWHCVIELSPSAKRVTIKKSEPLCRIIPVRRDTYFAQQLSPVDFDDFFACRRAHGGRR